MPHFLAIYTGTAESRARSGWDALEPEARRAREQEGMRAWGEWMARHRDRVVQAGGPLGKTLRVSADGIAPIRNAMAGYVVIHAADHAEAAALFTGHPHFTIFPGDAVEVMKVLPIPGA